ncbi:MAG: thiamine pyrophosphate-binding protein [Dolichospermum sp.]|jgi:thiamine pyrophosphate-dependent acetolactate synthase large subunit-like protein|uniref:thiamine pyrophosphate-binding protein n=1 Tax=unclassified Microcystis TaxID=2643300 RepID=UPI00258B07E9|nr:MULTISPECIES: thiamine pyrophosphate-binding protein [unclassified Microcystis]MCA2666588.1 thiamine pyrophosphate-binding protein [Microcystis sp. M045S2]MCA2713160.1 thiamine pyrophosphate-binding protein [Microcystis sp. M172S2]MCA2803724.1 thiamine pyrophosphate-binding protein [Microcystis sp. M114S2]MCA2834791.1 thiamine pyrophosphate-binding protein [Microcystis sp. M007S1]MCA2837002.1 thiamine pyrophosphate-binding protein [Microcystis sp. M078S1]
MAGKTGRFAILEQFLADGFTYMFGNPGTSEEGFLDALGDYPDLKYILTLQESVAVMTADGYARATGKPALVQIHSTPGLGNAIGALYQAKRGHSPLVVIGGDAGIKYQAMDAQMAGDLLGFAEPVTKWSTLVMEPSSLLRVLRRAVKIATTPPMGPVYVCLPVDILDAPTVEPVRPTSLPSTRVIPDEVLVKEMAEILASSQKPMIFVGDGVSFSEAQAELTQVAELLGAEVWGADIGDLNMSYTHPLYQGSTGHMFGYSSKPITTKGDVNLVVGTYMLPEVFPDLGDIFAPGAKVLHIDLNAYEIAKNHPVDIGVVSDPKLTLAKLAIMLESILNPEQKAAAKARTEAIGQAKAQNHQRQLDADRQIRDHVPLHLSRFMEELAAKLPEDAVIFDEAITNSPAITRYFPPTKPRHYFVTRGGSLGVGIPGAIGAKLAHPDKTVIGFAGDGGAMYTIQALWTAARHNIDVKFVICNNRSYRILQENIDAYWQERNIPERDYPLSFDLSKPDIHFASIAQSLGVPGVRVEKPADIASAIEQMLNHPGPFLIDVVLEANVHPEKIGVK